MKDLRKVALGLATLASFVSFATMARAQQQAQSLKVTNVRDNVYWVQGGVGSNDGFIVGTTGVVLVDTKTTVDSEKGVIAEIAKVTPKTVDTVILTHSDVDHVNGLAAFPAGLTIIAQENCKKEMEESVGTRNPAPQDRLPTKTYAKTDILRYLSGKTKQEATLEGFCPGMRENYLALLSMHSFAFIRVNRHPPRSTGW